MKQHLAKLLVEICIEDDVEARLMEDYSGRGMYGKTTYAVIVPRVEDMLCAVLSNLPSMKGYDPARVAGLSSDALGKDVVVY